MAEGFKIADAYVEIHVDKDSARASIAGLPADMNADVDRAGQKVGDSFGKSIGKGAGKSSQKSGDDVGNKLAQGTRMALIRNSPLIAAAIGGALAAGAPLALAGATLLFAGIGAVSAAQSDVVKSAWLGLWSEIRTGAQNDSAVLVPVIARMAGQIGASFERIRPQLRGAFADIAPQVGTFTSALLRAAENALPGFTYAVRQSSPVIQGFGSFLESTGTGLSEFFDAMSEHSPAAGAAFAALGDIIENLLPTLGTLLGQGAELASIVLPPVAQILGAVADAADRLGPLLPMLALGFAGLKAGQSAAGWLESLGGKMSKAGTEGSALNTTAGRLGQTVGAFGRVLPVVGIAVAAWGLTTQNARERADQFNASATQMMDLLGQGGEKGAIGARGIAAMKDQLAQLRAIGADKAANDLQKALDAATAASKQHTAGLTAQEAAAEAVKARTADLSYAIETYGAGSRPAAQAANALTSAQREQERANGELEAAIHGVTAAMVEQANQAMAAIDSGFAYQNSLNQLEDAQTDLADAQAHLNDANKDTRTSSEDVQRAQLAVAEQAYATAEAFGKQQADMSGAKAGTEEYTRLLQQNTLQELYRLRDAAGPEMSAALQQQISMLEASGVSLSETGAAASAVTQRMQGLGFQITAVPGYKGVTIDAPTEDQRRRIEDLGYKVVTLPNGRVYVTTDTGDAERALAYLTRTRTSLVNVVYSGSSAGVRGATGAYANAAGGPLRFAVGGSPGGKLRGPGTSTSDSIAALTMDGRGALLSNDEWIVKAASARKYTDQIMSAVNQGTATITAAGKTVGPQARQVVGQQAGTTIHIGSVTIPVSGTFDLTDPRQLRNVGEKIRQAIIDLERESK